MKRKKFWNKRGESEQWMYDNFGRILLGVIGLLVLGYLAYKIITGLTSGNVSEQATSSLNNIITAASSGHSSVQVYNPSGWYITSFPAKFSMGKVSSMVARQCLEKGWKKCICVYKGDFQSPSVEGSVDTVGFTGACQESNFTVQGTAVNTNNAFLSFVDKYLGISNIEPHIENSIQINPPLPITLEIDKNTQTISEGYSASSPTDLATSSLQKVQSAISSGSSSVEISEPHGWYLESFPMTVKGLSGDVTGQVSDIPVPPFCSDKGWTSCMCLCGYNFRYPSECDSANAVCVQSDFTVSPANVLTWSGVREIFIGNSPVTLELNPSEKTITAK